jgi:hypothetical protein
MVIAALPQEKGWTLSPGEINKASIAGPKSRPLGASSYFLPVGSNSSWITSHPKSIPSSFGEVIINLLTSHRGLSHFLLLLFKPLKRYLHGFVYKCGHVELFDKGARAIF